jgi:hypothetical protein
MNLRRPGLVKTCEGVVTRLRAGLFWAPVKGGAQTDDDGGRCRERGSAKGA